MVLAFLRVPIIPVNADLLCLSARRLSSLLRVLVYHMKSIYYILSRKDLHTGSPLLGHFNLVIRLKIPITLITFTGTKIEPCFSYTSIYTSI